MHAKEAAAVSKHTKNPTDWSQVPWTPFREAARPTDAVNALDTSDLILVNSRYQVTVYLRGEHPIFGAVAHLSFKTHDKQPYHDWRDMQRIKNEVCGPEYDAVEIYPAESKLVDTSNQYHLFVFRDYKLDIGFQERLVGDGDWTGPTGGTSKQRPWLAHERPADCLSPADYQQRIDAALAKAQARRDTNKEQL
jgi:hypothetical protein